MIEIISPAGFEHFFHEVSEIVAAGPPFPPEADGLAQPYGLEFGEPEWLADVITRFGLTPPG